MLKFLKDNHMPIQRYRDFVMKCADAQSGTTFFNEGVPHAKIVIENIFRVSKHEVDILTKELAEDVYGEQSVIDSALNFLKVNESAKLIIASEKNVTDSHVFIRAMTENKVRDRVQLSTIPSDKVPHFNFAVGDTRNIRFEPDKNKFNAMCRFGDEKTGHDLVKKFKTVI